MCNFYSEIKVLFGKPSFTLKGNSLIEDDSYDLLEKEEAIKYFSNKSYADVLKDLHLGSYYLEEWSVLNTTALNYYARAYFEYLLEALDNKEPDEEFIFFLMGALYQLIYMHKGSPFSSEQTDLIIKLVKHTAIKAENQECFEYFSNDIKENIQEFFNELNKYNS
jgi:hypothetical protein